MNFLRYLKYHLFNEDGNYKIRRHNEPEIKKIPWYSKSFTATYWYKHYFVHMRGVCNIGDNSKNASGTYDLSLIYLTQFQYSNSELKKIKKIIKKICLSYLKEKKRPRKDSLFYDFIIENIVFSYILGFLELNEFEFKLMCDELFKSYNLISIPLNLRENSFYMFPYFVLLFQNSFEDRIIQISRENINEVKELFTSQKTYLLIQCFVKFCVNNQYGVFQYKDGTDGLSGSFEYKQLKELVENDMNIFLTSKNNEHMFDYLKLQLDIIKKRFNSRNSLSLYHQYLTSIPQQIDENITYLNLNSNAISELNFSKKHKNIEILILNNNKITTIKHIEQLEKLKKIDLKENPIENITRSSLNFIKNQSITCLLDVKLDNLRVIENE